MKITICGSMTHKVKMSELSTALENRGYTVETPNIEEGRVRHELDADPKIKQGFIDEHFAKIDTSEAILVVNEEKNGISGYIGGNTLIEMSHAYAQGLDIFVLNDLPDVSYADEIRGMHPMVLDGDISKVDEYEASLPLLYMSTESKLKHAAASRAMRYAGIPVRVAGTKVDSGVNEQPLTVEETYAGAMNRHAGLKNLGVAAAYFATIESGQHPIHPDHSLFGCSVIVVEEVGRNELIGIDLDVEFPQEMLDKVPSVYPDLGALVQQEYGATEKDPFPYFTGGRLTRQKVLERAFYDVAIRLDREDAKIAIRSG